ncbi:putative phosphoesterase [Bacillus oleivorans]|uniref:Putative phosphoesterase n=1 Tax=Bacillus oleivorans TaxID=1448271 RepID=A0A285D4E3_9BACI|nr:metallophosphoesterase [Bacillus oleivorans]SNX74694.1 putative phosphoesterase [Bacillus oleivorans]
MKVGVISDLHIDRNAALLPENTSFAEILADLIKKLHIDILLIAGDISNDYRMSIDFLNELERLSHTKVLFVPGNHDYWSKENGVTNTWDIYHAFNQWNGCIMEQAFHLNDDWVVVGNSGWYDYSFGSEAFSEAEFNQGYYMERTWQDFNYVNWGRENKEMCQFFYRALEADLQKHKGKNIIMMTHMLTHPQFTVPMPNQLWEFFNAFLGSRQYSDLYNKYHVKYGIMGHVHYRKIESTDTTTMICACLGNHDEWKSENLVNELNEALVVFEVK